jgi:glucose/arabinose dehydrogenase
MSKRLLSVSAGILCGFAAGLAWENPKVQLPAPFATPSVANGPKIVERPDGARLQVPNGFAIDEYAAGFQRPRFMLNGPDNQVLLSDMANPGAVYVLTDGGKNRKKLLEGLDRPYGLALWKQYLYVAESTSIKRYKYDSKAITAGTGEEIVPLKDFGKGHVTRSLIFDRKNEKMYVGIGSSADLVTGDPESRAAINRYNPDGSGHEVFAAGLRNPVGLHWYPGTDTLWAAVQERDFLGDDLVPDYFTHVQKSGFYGWPYAYIGPHEDPRNKGKEPALVAKSLSPDVILGPHVAVLDYTFYTGKQFPAEYRDGAFLAFHGSSNRAKRVGYSVAFLPFKKGKPAGELKDFLTGWMISPDSKEVWGRPVAVLQLPDGSLLISDDGGKRVWRISYKG